MPDAADSTGSTYARTIADQSHEWYRLHAIRSRRAYRTAEILFLVLSAAIPASAVLASRSAVIPALLGSVLVLFTGSRGVFHWQENYVRFSRAREAVNGEIRMYLTDAEPDDEASRRDQLLVAAVSRIEQEETGQWVRVVTQRPRLGRSQDQ